MTPIPMSESRVRAHKWIRQSGWFVSMLLPLVPGPSYGAAADHLRPALAAEALTLDFTVDSTDDGPHVYWKNDSTAYVIYLCDGELLSRGIRVAEELRFRGYCSDSTHIYELPVRPPEIKPYSFEGVPRVFSVSDIHGEYGELVRLLENANVIDGENRWSWGNGHLVVLGDVFDRGDMVTECLWLLRRLERQATQSGGMVHLILGNHEEMVLRGDLRYVSRKYISGIAERSGIPYNDMFGPDMDLGRWLRTKHTAIEINDILYVHGGMAPSTVERGLSIDTMNAAVRRSLDFRSYELLFSDLEWFLLSGEGPLWYRGYHEATSDYPRATSAAIDSVLDFYGVEAVVVGHHEVDRVEGRYHGRVIGIDVPVDQLDGLQGLLWKDGKFFRVLNTGELEAMKPI